MAKKSKTNKRSRSSGGFFARLFDFITALVILSIAGAAVWYFVFYETGEKQTVAKKIEKLKEKEPVPKKEPVFDPSADDEEMDRIDGDYFDGGDEMNAQFEEFTSGFDTDFTRSVKKWASKYDGLKFKLGADPDKDKASDNSHLICAIWRNSAVENNMKFKGYMNSEEILKNVSAVKSSEIRNGDLIVLKDKTFGMITDYVSNEDFRIIYASDSKSRVLKTDDEALKYYWLKKENLKGFYRPNRDILD